MKGDLDKDGKLSGYEQARQDAIEKSMAEQRIKKAEGGYDLHEDFIDSNDRFILRMAKLSMQDVKNEKDRDKAIQLYIQDKSKVAKTLGLNFDKDFYTKEISDKIRELAEEQNPLLGVRQIKQEGGSMDDQMMMVMKMKPMESDQEMEDNYTQFIMEEALTEKEEDMLMSKLEQDEELAMLFDKVIDVAQEFAGSGPVEGPGSGVSDSIPARLSDGEFVFTAKATEEIGADELMRMMKDAEAAADKRQGMAHGGTHMDSGEEQILSDIARPQVVNQGTNVLEEDEMSKTIKDNMVNPNVQNDYVRS